ncbi:MAG: type I-A CRISPR-associated protein Cas7/Csa2 [Archaeoglobaceae archaeon]|nr:type I-A CRISPR-associated protein Cas7/Csa2 [Archaeoglobaceae archaeon]
MFVRISGRMRINTHSLNAQGGGGTNYIEVTKAKVVVRNGSSWSLVEVPVITGNMLKHCHFVGFVDCFKETKFKDNLTEKSLRYNAVRFATKETTTKKAGGNEIKLDDEAKIIENFADADIHGFLVPETGVRRISLIKTSFLIPTEDFLMDVMGEKLISTVKHNRVDVDEKGAIGRGEETAQMLFSREYASALYGFSVVLDLGFVGVPQSNTSRCVINEEERIARIECALKALIAMLSGYIGANLARSFPAIKVEELIAIKSDKPIPALVHGFYADYVKLSESIINNAKNLGFEVNCYSIGVDLKDFTKVSSVEELVKVILDERK